MSDTRHNLSGTRVVLGLSGGVDSAVAAILLRQQGADVHALHMTNWEDDDGYCTAAADLQDARRICDQLGIPLHHVNFAREYRDQVFAYFLEEYRAGRTPNPDVLCNREIKFGVFLDYARRLGGDRIATGHYARTELVNGRTFLLKGLDRDKDQSYFLHAVSEPALADSIFPLGNLTKPQIREIARDHVLDVHDKKDSTGICFIGERPFREFLSSYLPASPGLMKTPEGDIVGEHQGLMYYTLGQRQGLGIGGRADSNAEPWYVVGKTLEDNTLIVAQGEHPLRFCEGIRTGQASWINGDPGGLSSGGMRCKVKLRYRQPDQACTVTLLADGCLDVEFDESQRDVAPGQFAVFYEGDRCLGGAAIADTIAADKPLRMTG
jgi:tRNA-specific 2-thiouridylase